MTDILLIRHGMTEYNHDDPVRDRIRSWGNMELSELGRKEAVRLAEAVKGYVWGMILTSDLLRARQTAHVIAARNDLPMRASKDFRPWNTGDYAGKSAAEVVPILTQYAQQSPGKPVPGGESFDSFRFRFFNGLLKALREHENISIVTHHRNERLLKAWQKAGWPLDGSIDEEEFCRKGSPTGHHEVISIPEDRLEKVVEMRSGVWA